MTTRFPNGITASIAHPLQTLTDDGAITVRGGVCALSKSSAIAATLADPSSDDDGIILHIVSLTAKAHTITNTSGFNAGGSSSDVATLGGAIGDGLTVVAVGGKWYVLSNTNATLA